MRRTGFEGIFEPGRAYSTPGTGLLWVSDPRYTVDFEDIIRATPAPENQR